MKWIQIRHEFLHQRVEEWRDRSKATGALVMVRNLLPNREGETTYAMRGFVYDDDVYYDMQDFYPQVIPDPAY